MTQSYDDLYWNSDDGLRLHARDHAADARQAPRGTVVCIPGLTRNGADFDALAETLTAEGWRVIAVDLRGRAGSERAHDPSSYNPRTYADDMVALLRAQNIDKAVFVGTSLGVLVTITLASRAPERVAGAVPTMPAPGCRVRRWHGSASTPASRYRRWTWCRPRPTWNPSARLRSRASAPTTGGRWRCAPSARAAMACWNWTTTRQ
jgi:pimeloyl-ACP methyl ester carboxylesterase